MLRGPRAWVGELIGTFGFITIGVGSVVVVTSTSGGFARLGTFGIAVAHGIGLAVMVSALMSLTGAHFNPAVTLSVWLSGRMRSIDAIGYVGAQVLGGVGAAVVIRLLFDRWGVSNLGTPAIAPDVSIGVALLAEAVFTFFLVTVIYGTGVDERGHQVGGFAIGFTVFAGILVVGDLTGAALNPARFLGPAIVSGAIDDWWVYLVGPAIGGLVALVYPLFFLPEGVRGLRLFATETS